MTGEVRVVGQEGNQNVWGLAKGFLPRWAERRLLAEDEVERMAAQRAIRALGTATPSGINYSFVRGRYRSLRRTLASREAESVIRRIHVGGMGLRDERYVHDADVPLLAALDPGRW
jgi:uncharacterized protein YcaQ